MKKNVPPIEQAKKMRRFSKGLATLLSVTATVAAGIVFKDNLLNVLNKLRGV